MSGSIQSTTSKQNINGQYQITPGKTSVSQLPANKAMEALLKTMHDNISSTQKIAYRNVSEGTKGLSVYKAIWQGIKNISHNIEAFAKNTWNAEKRTQSALNIAGDVLAIAESLNGKEKEEELVQAFKDDPQGAIEMMAILETQKEAILDEITKWHKREDIPEKKIAVEGKERHKGEVGTLKHSGDCGVLLKEALDSLSAVGKLLAARAKEAGEIRQQEIHPQKDTEIYNKHTNLKSFLNQTLESFRGIHNELKSALQQDPNASLEGTKERIGWANLAYKIYNTGMKEHEDDLKELKGNVALKSVQENILDVSKKIDDIMDQFYSNLNQKIQELE